MLEHDPANIKATKEVIKRKEEYIQALRNQLKLPSTKHPQAKEVASIKMGKENLLIIVVEHNTQILKMQ